MVLDMAKLSRDVQALVDVIRSMGDDAPPVAGCARHLLTELDHMRSVSLTQLAVLQEGERAIEVQERRTPDQVKRPTVCTLGHSMGGDRTSCVKCGSRPALEVTGRRYNENGS
jgi:malonyl CoA-acyl carrier protein transacylase